MSDSIFAEGHFKLIGLSSLVAEGSSDVNRQAMNLLRSETANASKPIVERALDPEKSKIDPAENSLTVVFQNIWSKAGTPDSLTKSDLESMATSKTATYSQQEEKALIFLNKNFETISKLDGAVHLLDERINLTDLNELAQMASVMPEHLIEAKAIFNSVYQQSNQGAKEGGFETGALTAAALSKGKIGHMLAGGIIGSELGSSATKRWEEQLWKDLSPSIPILTDEAKEILH